MARTFRLRHCPSLPGTAKHFAFTHASAHIEKDREVIRTAEKLVPDIRVRRSRWHKDRYLKYDQDRDALSVISVLEGQLVVPLLSPHFHPWRRRYGINMKCAKFWRKRAHKSIRRLSKHLLNASQVDYDALSLPAWYEHFDRWSFT